MNRRSFLKRAGGAALAVVAAPLFIPAERLEFGVPKPIAAPPVQETPKILGSEVTLRLPAELWRDDEAVKRLVSVSDRPADHVQYTDFRRPGVYGDLPYGARPNLATWAVDGDADDLGFRDKPRGITLMDAAAPSASERKLVQMFSEQSVIMEQIPWVKIDPPSSGIDRALAKRVQDDLTARLLQAQQEMWIGALLRQPDDEEQPRIIGPSVYPRRAIRRQVMRLLPAGRGEVQT